jgi:CBS domain-containing protein
VRHNIGGLVVTDGPAPVGIISERDILRLTAQGPERLADLRVGDVMTRDLVVAAPDHELRGAMAVMTERRIRHLPVVREGRLVGIVSIGDLVNASLSIVQDENQHLRQYIQGGV